MNGPRRHPERTSSSWSHSLFRKYVLLCLICGSVSLILGSFILVISFLIRSYTSTLQYFETIPTYIPAIMLFINGLLVMRFAKKQSRFAYLIKFTGLCCVVSAIVCIVITVTTVVHMNRLGALHECVYAPKVKTCTCLSTVLTPASVVVSDSTTTTNIESNNHGASHHFTFHNTSSCNVIQGSLHACLRALFGLSVLGILICIFSSMLVYQLLSHERKKLYLDQLEVRRRFEHTNRNNHNRLQPHLHHLSLTQHLPHQHAFSHNSLRNPQHPHFCNCQEDAYYPLPTHYPTGWPPPPPPWDVMEYRSYFRNDESHSNLPGNLQPNRNHSWTNWLPVWPWNHDNSTNTNQNANLNDNANAANCETINSQNIEGTSDGFFSRLFRRNRNGITDGNQNANRRQNTMQRRSQNILPPPHVFIPRLSTLPSHLARYRNASHPYGMRGRMFSVMNHSSNRRTRSNDGIFHHLNNLPPPGIGGYVSPQAVPPSVFALWGPPPPYTCSQPASLDRLDNINGQSQNNVGRRRSSNSRHSNDPNSASKMSTPISERRMHCNAFTSDSITLTIGSGNENSNGRENNYSKSSCIVEVHVPYDNVQHHQQLEHNAGVHHENIINISGVGGHKISDLTNSFNNSMPHLKQQELAKSNENSHVQDLAHSNMQTFHPFNSLSNIPLNFSNKINIHALPQMDMPSRHHEATIISTDYPKFTTVQNVCCTNNTNSNNTFNSPDKSSTQSLSTSDTTSTTTSTGNTSQSQKASSSTPTTSFPTDNPSDYKSTLLLPTSCTHSSPASDKDGNSLDCPNVVDLKHINYAQSMPNLSCIIAATSSQSITNNTTSPTHSNPQFWDLHRVPSSGNTSTSQDFADYELELDDESIKFSELPQDKESPTKSSRLVKRNDRDSTSTESNSTTPEFLQPPTPFNTNHRVSSVSSSSNTISSASTATPSGVKQADNIFITIKSIQV